jgi:aryl-alcohol dehydrogenase-like predicted oxidoreductase
MFRREASEKSQARIQHVAVALNPMLPESKRTESMSRKALWVLASTPGVTCVLNGMRTVRYVQDSTAVLGWTPLSDPGAVYNAILNVTGL